MSAPAAAAAAQAAKTVVQEAAPAAAKAKVSAFSRLCVQPVMRTLNKIENRSAVKLGTVDAVASTWIQKNSAEGKDAASTATEQYLHLQKQLVSYRVVRLFEEGRYVFSGRYFKEGYGVGKALQDMRFLTQMLFVFIIAVMVGRRGVFSPIAPDSPFAITLDHKENPNY